MLSFWSDYLWFLDEVCRPRWWFVSNKSTSVPTNFTQYCWKSFDLMNSKKLLWCKVLRHVWLRCLNLFQGITQYSNLSCIFFFLFEQKTISQIHLLYRLYWGFKVLEESVSNLQRYETSYLPKITIVQKGWSFTRYHLVRLVSSSNRDCFAYYFFFSLLLYIPWLTYLLPFMRHRTFG